MKVTEFCVTARVAVWERKTYAPYFGHRFVLIREDGDEMAVVASRPTEGALLGLLRKAARRFTASVGVSQADARAALAAVLADARLEADRGVVVTEPAAGPYDDIVQGRRRPRTGEA